MFGRSFIRDEEKRQMLAYLAILTHTQTSFIVVNEGVVSSYGSVSIE